MQSIEQKYAKVKRDSSANPTIYSSLNRIRNNSKVLFHIVGKIIHEKGLVHITVLSFLEIKLY
jgi:hypothetical protein